MMKLALLALAGALGTVARFGVMEGMKRLVPGVMPWGTWTANKVGCFLFGLIVALAEEARRGEPGISFACFGRVHGRVYRFFNLCL